MEDNVRIAVTTDTDIVHARQLGLKMAASLPFTTSELAAVATAIAELARNLRSYAAQGTLQLSIVQRGSRHGMRIVAQDAGPGIQDPTLAQADGFSTAGRGGRGLGSVRRSVDEYEIDSQVGVGTTITLHKWAR